MFAHKALIAAVTTVTLGLAGTALAGDSDLIGGSDRTQRTGANDSLGTINRQHGANQHRQPHVWKGQRANNQILNVGNPLPERTVFGDVGDIDNSKTGTLNRLPGGDGMMIDRSAVVASDRMTPAPVVVQQHTVVQQPVIANRTEMRVEDNSMANANSNSGLDNRFLKPGDPAVVTPDHKRNAGIDRTLRQDYNLGRADVAVVDNRVNTELALKDISNHPIDSQADARFRGPSIPEGSNDSARMAGETIRPETHVAPTTQPSSYVPVAPAPMGETYSNSTYSHSATGLGADRTGANDSLGMRNTSRDDRTMRQPHVWKGQRANNELLNVGNPLPEKTVFGKVGDIDNSKTGTLNRLGTNP